MISWERKKRLNKEAGQRYYQKNKERINKKQKERYWKNVEDARKKRRESMRKFNKTEWGKKYKREYMKKYLNENKEEKNKQNELTLKYYYDNREILKKKYMERAKENVKKLKEIIFNHYGKKCMCCGETETRFLCIDHINGDGKKHREELGSMKKWTGRGFYEWIINNNYPDTLQLLCYNCNMVKRNAKHRFCPVHHPELYIEDEKEHLYWLNYKKSERKKSSMYIEQ